MSKKFILVILTGLIAYLGLTIVLQPRLRSALRVSEEANEVKR